MLMHTILDNLWQAGFCRRLIEQLRQTRPGQADSARRLALTEQHIREGCQDCFYANLLKGVEAETAKLLGPEAEAVWLRGGDVRAFPDFDEAFRAVMGAAIKTGHIRPGIMAWIAKTVKKRAGKAYPYKEEADGPT